MRYPLQQQTEARKTNGSSPALRTTQTNALTSLVALQRTVGNQAVLKSLESHARVPEGDDGDTLKFSASLVQVYNAALDDLFSSLQTKKFADFDVASEEDYFSMFPITDADVKRQSSRYERYRALEDYRIYTMLRDLLRLSERKNKEDIRKAEHLISSLSNNDTNRELRVLAHGLVLFEAGSLRSEIVDITTLNDDSVIQPLPGTTFEKQENVYKRDLYKEHIGYPPVTRRKTNDPAKQYLFVNEEESRRKHLLILSSLIASAVENISATPTYDFENFGLTTNQVMNSFNRALGYGERDYGGTVGGKNETSLAPRPISDIPPELRYKEIHHTRGIDVYDRYHNVMLNKQSTFPTPFQEER